MGVGLPPWGIWRADVSSVGPSSGRVEELWVVVVCVGVWRSFAIGGDVGLWVD